MLKKHLLADQKHLKLDLFIIATISSSYLLVFLCTPFVFKL